MMPLIYFSAGTDADFGRTTQAISGHLSRKMLEHDSHVRLEAKRQAVAALDALNQVPVQ